MILLKLTNIILMTNWVPLQWTVMPPPQSRWPLFQADLNNSWGLNGGIPFLVWILLRWLILKISILTRFSNRSYIYNSVQVKNTWCFISSYHMPISNIKIILPGNLTICEFKSPQSPDQLGESLNGCSKCEPISNMKIQLKLFYGFSQWDFVCPLGRHYYLFITITQSDLFSLSENLYYVGGWMGYFSIFLFSGFSKILRCPHQNQF